MKKIDKILFASNNRGKYDELADDFKKVGIDLVFCKDIGIEHLDLPETSEMLSVNAYTKAKAAAFQTGMVSMGDDSGVFIEALSYFPGVHSRRWFGDEKDDSCRNQKILELMKNENERDAYLVSNFSVVDIDGEELATARVNNHYYISYRELGEHGFGYDRILIPDVGSYTDRHSMRENLLVYTSGNIDSFDGFGKTIAELTQEEKNAITYRGRIAKEIDKKINGGEN